MAMQVKKEKTPTRKVNSGMAMGRFEGEFEEVGNKKKKSLGVVKRNKFVVFRSTKKKEISCGSN